MNQNMLKKLQKMQKDLEEAQERLKNTVFTGTAGGVVTVEVYGTKLVKKISIEGELEVDDKEMLEDMIVVAINDAIKQVEKEEEGIAGNLSGGMGGFPGLF